VVRNYLPTDNSKFQLDSITSGFDIEAPPCRRIGSRWPSTLRDHEWRDAKTIFRTFVKNMAVPEKIVFPASRNRSITAANFACVRPDRAVGGLVESINRDRCIRAVPTRDAATCPY